MAEGSESADCSLQKSKSGYGVPKTESRVKGKQKSSEGWLAVTFFFFFFESLLTIL